MGELSAINELGSRLHGEFAGGSRTQDVLATLQEAA
jgi:hypothetical protein